MEILDILLQDNILAKLRGTSKREVLEELAVALVARHRDIGRVQLVEALPERERRGSTAIGEGVAIPHCRMRLVPGVIAAAFGPSRSGVEFEAPDGGLTQFFFLLVAPEGTPDGSVGFHLKALTRASRLFRDLEFRQRLLTAE